MGIDLASGPWWQRRGLFSRFTGCRLAANWNITMENGSSLLSHRLALFPPLATSPSPVEPPPILLTVGAPPRTSPPHPVQAPPPLVQRRFGHSSKSNEWQLLLWRRHAPPPTPNPKIHCFLCRLRRGQSCRRWLRGASSSGSDREEGGRRGKKGNDVCTNLDASIQQ
jgi:hypothetical protein